MNPLAKLFLYVAAVVLLAALLSPPIYWALHPLMETVPFRRFFSRTALIVALALLWPVLRWMHVRRFSELGLERNARAWVHLRAGLALVAGPLALLAVFYLTADIWRIREEILWKKIPAVVATAAVVPVLEEFLFRGVLLGLAVRSFGRGVGVIGISLVFAAVHFIDSRYDVTDVTWGSGFDVLSHAFSNSGGAVLALSGGVSLFVLGVIFALATLRTRSLWLAIGLHAGCIFGQQILSVFAKFRFGKDPMAWMPWAGPNVVHGMVPTGLVPLAALLVIGGLVWWYLAREPRPPAPADARRAG
ncbi:MAG TPA: CPBP family intramembrane glutamic endopeptidase [Chthoniobacterales bacterium]